MVKCSLELWPVLVWWTIVFTMIIPFTTLFWVAFLILLALTPLFEIVNTVRGKRTPISRWRWDAAIEAYEPDEPITTQATQHWSTVDVETPLGVPRLMFYHFLWLCLHTHTPRRPRPPCVDTSDPAPYPRALDADRDWCSVLAIRRFARLGPPGIQQWR